MSTHLTHSAAKPSGQKPVGSSASLRSSSGPPGRGKAIFILVILFVGACWASTVRAQGPLPNGWTHTGTISPGGDTDSWTFSADLGNRIVLRAGEITQVNNFTPRIRLMTPNGVQQAVNSGTVAAEVSVIATNGGTFTVLIDGVNATATGTYRLTLAQVPGLITVAPGDEGGPLTNGVMHPGTIDVGDLDVWSFTLCAGEPVVLRLDELVVGSSLTPWLRLYGRDGTLMRSVSGVSTAQVSVLATNTGIFTVVASDGSGAYAYAGAYRLTVNGLSHDLRLCVPRASDATFNLSGAGGASGAEFTVFSSPLVEAPFATWTPLFTNQFDFFGTFIRVNAYPRSEPRRFFLLQQH